MPDIVIRNPHDWKSAIRFVQNSLAHVELPLGILANTDITAAMVLEATSEMGIDCPNELAVMGIWNYGVVCRSTRPHLTSIEVDYHRFGYEASSILDKMLDDPEYEPPAITRTEGRKLFIRQSTDFLSFDDELVSAALRYIREHAPLRSLSVNEVIDQVPMSRSSFTTRFKKAVGHSAKTEITKVRLNQVKKLLLHTDWTITRIAEEIGFDSGQDLSRIFRKKMGQTPSDYRELGNSQLQSNSITLSTQGSQ